MSHIKCTYCNRHTDKGGGATWDHVVPRSKGGSNDRSNKVIACAFCNSIKDNNTLEEWHNDLQLIWKYRRIFTASQITLLGRIKHIVSKLVNNKNQ